PGRGEVQAGAGREPPDAVPVRVHHVDVLAALAIAVEGDARAVRAPARVLVQARIAGKHFRGAAVRVPDPDLLVPAAGRGEEKALPVGAPARKLLETLLPIDEPGRVA